MLMWGSNLCQSPPSSPRPAGLQFGQCWGSLRGPCWHGGDTAVTRGPGAPRPRQLCYQPLDGCCWAMAVSQPRAGQGGPPFIIGDGHSALGLSFLPFFFPTQWKTIFERLHHAGVSGAAGGERG